MITLTLLLLAAIALWIFLRQKASAARGSIGLPTHGTVIAADDSRIGAPTLRSRRLGLIGRPDHIIRSGQMLIPVEQKPRATRLQPAHIYQVAALCLLINDQFRVRPPYGIVVLAGGRQQRVAFTPELEQRVLATMREMRGFVKSGQAPGRRWVAYKCEACGYRNRCWN